MKRIIYILSLILIVTSCDDFSPGTFDGGQTLVYFNDTSANLDVIVDATGTLEVQINTTTLSNTDRTVTFQIVEEDTNADAENYVISSFSATIPAGEYFGSFVVEGVDNSVEPEPKLLLLELVDAGDDAVISAATLEISIKQVCPIPDDFMVGLYTLDDTGGFPNFNSGIEVDLRVGEVSTQRQFDATFLPTTGVATDVVVTIDLACNTFILQEIDINVQCSGPPYLVTSAGNDNSGYSIDSDVVHLINYLQDPEASCGDASIQNITLTKL